MTLYKNRYRIESTRLPYWDYSANGYYFVTVCTHDRRHYFGQISDGTTELSAMGKTAQQYWSQIPDHFPFVTLDEYVVMPNHVHGIVVIGKNADVPNVTPVAPVETQNIASLQPTTPSTQPSRPSPQPNTFGPQSQNLASIIRGFKTGVKKYATLNNMDFAWQPRFHDHIIRDEKELDRIRAYIANNPANWQQDDQNI